MLYNDTEREVMKNAIQPWLRGRTHPDGEDLPLDRNQVLIEKFLGTDYFLNKRVLELGPGQCDFLDIARGMGAATFGVDFDPAIIELGRLRGHQITLANMSEGWPLQGQVFDGIYSRVSNNIYAYNDVDRFRCFLAGIAASLTKDGWLLFVPFNQPYANPQAEAIRAETDLWLAREGIELLLLPEEQLVHLQIADYGVPLHEVWYRGLPPGR